MDGKPFAAASAAATTPALSGVGTTDVRFGMPHALVITACIVTAAILAPSVLEIRDILALLAGAGGIGAAVVVVASGGRRASRIGRLVRAYLGN